MIENNNDNKLYNAADIQRYLNGKMSDAEMHAFELAALEDAFLADAIEGYDEQKPDKNFDVAASLNDLRSQLENRVEPRRKNKAVLFLKTTWWRAAAVILVTAGSAYLFYYRSNNNTVSKEIVISDVRAPELPGQKADTTLTTAINKMDSSSLAVSDHHYKKSEQKVLKSSPLQKSEETPPVVSAAPSSAITSMPAKTDSATAPVNAEDRASLLSEPVITKSGTPQTTAPAFRKQIPDSLSSQSISDNAVASKDDKKAMANRKTMATGYGLMQKKEAEIAIGNFTTGDAVPVIGLAAYYNYLETNKKPLTDPAILHGEVMLSFIVNENGMLTDYKLEKSLSKRADNEAIRLIKEGPPWKVLKNQRTKATVTIKF